MEFFLNGAELSLNSVNLIITEPWIGVDLKILSLTCVLLALWHLVSKARGGWVAGLSLFIVNKYFCHWILWKTFRKNSNVSIYSLQGQNCKEQGSSIEFFTNCPQYKNSNIGNFVLAMLIERNWSNKIYNLEMYSHCIPWYLISHSLTSYAAFKEGNCKCMGIQSWQ